MSIEYCESWFYEKGIALGRLNENQANSRHKSGKSYCVLIGDAGVAPRVVIEVNAGGVSVNYLDAGLREIEQYEFERVAGGGLFLTSILVRVLRYDVPSRSNEAIRDTHVFYERSGLMTVSERNYQSGVAEIAELSVDLATNFKRFPEFGMYEDLLKEPLAKSALRQLP